MNTADAVLRIRATDISMFAMHFDGIAPPTPRFFLQPFGVDVSAFRALSEDLVFMTPELVTARTRVLDYFFAQKDVIKHDHIIFSFEESMLPGNVIKLIEQICWEIGFPSESLPLYLTGDKTEVLYNYPELGYFRDIVFMFKYLITGTAFLFYFVFYLLFTPTRIS